MGGRCGSRSASTLITCPSTVMLSPLAATVPGKRPSTLSYLSRWASISGVVMSLTATISSSGERSLAARNDVAPDAAEAVDANSHSHARQPPVTVDSAPGGAHFHPITALTCRGDQTVQAPGHRRPAAPGALRQLCQVVVGMAGSELGGLAECRWQRLPAHRRPPRALRSTRADAPLRPPSGAGWRSRR